MSSPRFNDFRDIIAEKVSIGRCGHYISPGDRIGWSKIHGAECQVCWLRWVEENAEAERIEGSGKYYY